MNDKHSWPLAIHGLSIAAVAAVATLMGVAHAQPAKDKIVAYGNTKTGQVHVGMGATLNAADNQAKGLCKGAASPDLCVQLAPCSFTGWFAVARYDNPTSHGFTRVCGRTDGGSVGARTAAYQECEKRGHKNCTTSPGWAREIK